MDELVQLKQDIADIKARNIRVEQDKAWEASTARKVLISILTYIVIVIFFGMAHLPNPFINAIVPTLGFLLSTLSIDVVKKWWIRRY